METVKLDNDINVFYVTAKSFPEGIQEAIDALHRRVPFSPGRKYFGISRPENNGAIIYRAAVEEESPGEGDKFNCETLTLEGGDYACLTLTDFRKDVSGIGRAFQELLGLPNLDPQGYCVEWYATDKEEVKCMVRLDQ